MACSFSRPLGRGLNLEESIVDLRLRLEEAWSAETAVDTNCWQRQNPAEGQCAVTALIVQDIFGGELLRSTVRGISHYWNQLHGGEHVDLTLEQFGSSPELDSEPVLRPRSYVLSFPETRERYERLRQKVLSEY